MSRRNLEIAAFAIVGVVILAIWGWQFLKPETSEPKEGALKTPEIKEFKIEEETPQYKLNASYPEFHGLGDSDREKAANEALKKEVEISVAQFKTSIKGAADISSEIKSELQIGYEIVNLNSSIASIKISHNSYIEGDRHPLGIFSSFNYNFLDNQKITLADLFNPGSNYLLALSGLSREKLKSQLKEYYSEESIELGTAPEPENFSVFFLTKDKLVITFNVYSVASYAAGSQTIEIPYEELAGVISQDGLIQLLRE